MRGKRLTIKGAIRSPPPPKAQSELSLVTTIYYAESVTRLILLVRKKTLLAQSTARSDHLRIPTRIC